MSEDQARRGKVLYADVRQGADGTVVGLTCNEWLHDAQEGSIYPLAGTTAWDFALGGTVRTDNMLQLIAALWRGKFCTAVELRNVTERGNDATDDDPGEPRGKMFVTIGGNNPVLVLNIMKELTGESQWPIDGEPVSDEILEPALRDTATRLLFPAPRPRS